MRSASLWLLRLLVVTPVLLLHPVADAAPPAAPAPPAVAAPAATPLPAQTLELDVRDVASGTTRIIRIAIAASTHGQPAELKTRIDDVYYRFQVRVLQGGSYDFEVERVGLDRGRDVNIRANRVLTGGQRGLLGRVTRADGSSTEIGATLR